MSLQGALDEAIPFIDALNTGLLRRPERLEARSQ
jgi:hypothetical protein